MSKSIPQLTAKTSTEDNDLLHIVRGNVDYKILYSDLIENAKSLNGKTIFVDSVKGSDITGVKESQANPYQTITSAQTAAVAAGGAWTIIINGAHTDSNLGASGISYYFMPNSTLSSAFCCFKDSGSSLQFNVLGYGVFISSGALTAVCRLEGSLSSVIFEGVSATGVDRCFWAANGSRLNVNIKDFIYSQNEACLRVDTHATNETVLTCVAKRIESETLCLQTKNGNNLGTIYVKADTISVNAAGTNYTFSEQIGGSIYVDSKCYQSTNGLLAMFHVSTGAIVCDVKGEIYNTSTSQFVSVQTGICNIHNKVTTNGKGVCSGGELNIFGFVSATPTNIESFTIAGGTLRLYNRVKNNTNNASSHAVVVSGGNLILKGAELIVTNASANSVYASSAQNIRVYSAVANYAAHANITNVITGTSIIVDTDVS